MSGELADQVALITGAARGIGRAIARRLAREGAYVVVNYLQNRAAAEGVLSEIRDAGGDGETLGLDVSDPKAVRDQFGEALKRLGRCHILINNAGVTADHLLIRLKEEDWERAVRVNLNGTFFCTKTVLPTMLRARYGRIVNLSSVAAHLGNVGQAAYCAAKAGIEGFTRSVAREVASRNVTVNAVAPGLIETDLIRDLPSTRKEEYLRLIPMGRFGSAEEVAEVVAFLVRPAAAYITGQVLGINGGLYM